MKPLPYSTDSFNGMPYVSVGDSGLRCPLVGLGLWKIGYPETEDGSRITESAAFSILDKALEEGCTLWDTANRYCNGSGNSERVIGKWIQRNPDEKKNIIIATKVLGCTDGTTPNHCRLSRWNILESVYASLDRLQISYLDILNFHGPDPQTPAEESLCVVEDLIKKDLVRYVGLCNMSISGLTRYTEAAKNFSPRCKIIAVQNKFNPLDGEDKGCAGVIEKALSMGISYIPYNSLAMGLLTNRYLDSNSIGPGDRLCDENKLDSMLTPSVRKLLSELSLIATSCDLEISQLVLAYTIKSKNIGPLIPGASSPSQVQSNALVAKTVLPQEVIDSVEKVFHKYSSLNVDKSSG